MLDGNHQSVFTNGRVLCADGQIRLGSVTIAGSQIVDVTEGLVGGGIDCGGALVLPGIVDIHGDSFERHVMPRPGVGFPLDIALRDNDRALAANGITTAFLGVGFSWEPGMRGMDSGAALIDAVHRLQPLLEVDTRIHLRFEVFNVDGADKAVAMIEDGRIDLIAFNEHLSQYERRIETASHELEPWARLAGLTVDKYINLLRQTRTREPEIEAALTKVVAAALAGKIAIASHDDASPEMRDAWRARGASLAEFPVNRETAHAAHAAGDLVIMGGPNVVRGGSQDGNVSAGAMIAEGYCTILASDYYYPSLLHAAFRMHAECSLALADAWALVSANPAAATGLSDRGTISPGVRADLVIIDDRSHAVPRVLGTVAAGRMVFCTAELADVQREFTAVRMPSNPLNT